MSDNITQQLAALRDKISSIHEDSDFPRMTEKQYQEFSAAVDEFETGYVDYDTLNLVMGSYTALDDGYYGDHDDKQNYEYNDLVLEFEKLVEKAAPLFLTISGNSNC